MMTTKLKEFLDKRHIHYSTMAHTAAITAQEVAASSHVPGKEFAKTVMLRIDDQLVMAVLPADRMVHLDQVQKIARAGSVELADEEDFCDLFPECEAGAMPPFGNLYGIDVFVDASMAEDEEIAFNAGTHEDLVKMAYRDFENLVHPVRMNLSWKLA